MMEQLAERRMQREQQAAQDLEEDSDADDDDDGEDEDDDDDDDDDDDEEEDEEEEVCCVIHSPPLCDDANMRRLSPRIRRWRRANGCSLSLPHACSNSECSRRTEKRLRRSVKCSCFGSLRMKTKRPRIARHAKQRRTRERRINGGLSLILFRCFPFV
jgi:hypothetical protein